ncbi:MAG: hypothetical protein IPL61_18035 [Myxococcales bacterium]|nr:hypothetical protein [Myxococcales bacterium]
MAAQIGSLSIESPAGGQGGRAGRDTHRRARDTGTPMISRDLGVVSFVLVVACGSAAKGPSGSQATPVAAGGAGAVAAPAPDEDYCKVLASYLEDAPAFATLRAQPVVSVPGMACAIREESELEVHCELHVRSRADADARFTEVVARVAGCLDEAAWKYSERDDGDEERAGIYSPNAEGAKALIGLYTDTRADGDFAVELDVVGY